MTSSNNICSKYSDNPSLIQKYSRRRIVGNVCEDRQNAIPSSDRPGLRNLIGVITAIQFVVTRFLVMAVNQIPQSKIPVYTDTERTR